MELTEITSKYAGKCSKCNRDIQVGWSIFYDKENKKVYCKPCGQNTGDSKMSDGTETDVELAMVRIPARFVDNCTRCNAVIDIGEEHYYQPNKNEVYCLVCGKLVIEMSRPETKASAEIKELIHSLALSEAQALSTSNLSNELILQLSENVADLATQLAKIEESIIVKVANQARDVAPKKQSKEPEETG